MQPDPSFQDFGKKKGTLFLDAATPGLSGTQAQPLHQGGCVKLAHLSAKGSCVDAKGQPVHCSELLFLDGISHIVRLWNKLRWSNLMPTWLNNLADRKDCEMAHLNQLCTHATVHRRSPRPAVVCGTKECQQRAVAAMPASFVTFVLSSAWDIGEMSHQSYSHHC